jgi:hypothetical protein
MSIKYKLLIAFSVTVLLATAVAVYGIHVVSNASTLVVRLYDGPLTMPRHRDAPRGSAIHRSYNRVGETYW